MASAGMFARPDPFGGGGARAPQRVDYLTGNPVPPFYEWQGRRYATEREMQNARSASLQQQADATGQGVGTSWGETFYPRANGGPNNYAAPGGGGGTGTIDFSKVLGSVPPFAGGGGSDPGESEDPRAVALGYARAKDRAGQEAVGAANSIRSLMQRRGLTGSPFAMAREARTAAHTALGRLGEYNAQEAQQVGQRRGQINDRNYAGALTRRGQDLNAYESRNRTALSLAELQSRNANRY